MTTNMGLADSKDIIEAAMAKYGYV
jgi:hypothetical protein